MQYFKRYIVAFVLILVSGGFVLTPQVVLASPSPESTVCSTLGSSANCSKTPPNGIDLNHVVSAVINILSIVVGIVAVIMIIVAGIRFVTSGGDSNNISSARSTIIYAIIGLVIVAVSQLIVKYVLNGISQ